MRHAISPRFATRTLANTSDPGAPARTPLAGRHAGSHTRRRIGVGFQPLHGLLSCGQLEITTSMSVSARISTYTPGRGDAVDDVEMAVGGDGHVHEEVDVGDEVALAHAVAREPVEEVVAAVVHGPRVLPNRHVLLSRCTRRRGVVATARVATIVASTVALARQQAEPVVRKRLRWARIVLAAL